jgi:hypothetical protein
MMNQFKTTTQKTSWKLYSFLLVLCLCASSSTAFAQIQKGLDIDGETAFDYSGWSVSMPDANTIAIGAYGNADNGSSAGHVRIYEWNGTTWVQKGLDIDGEAAGDYSGISVSMPDANTVAIGAMNNDGNGNRAGHVRIYSWNGTAWIQKGLDIDGEAAVDESGYSVSMPDANTLAIGAPYNDGNGSNAGHVRIYAWNGTAWVQKGLDIDGEAAGDISGWSVSMPDANTVAIGAPFNDGNGNLAGHVRIYSWNGTAWVQKGLDIDGEAADDRSGYSVSMPDANTVAIGAPYNAGNGNLAGHVRIYAWNGTAWTQKGLDIDGETAGDFSGNSVSMPDANTLAIGAIYNAGNGTDAGHVRIYAWNGTAWVQKGLDIDGEAAGDLLGRSVSMPDANTVAIGANDNDGNGNRAGHVRIYSICTTVNGTDTRTECNSYTWIDGNTYTSSNNTATFNIAGGAANGCDSLVTLDLTINQPTTFTQTFDECQGFSVTVGSNTYTSTGVYTDVLTNAAGCDSTVTTTLNISQPTTFSQTFDECQGFSVTVGGNTYNTTGVYTDVLTNAAGCDSTVTTTLNISQPTTFSQTFDECQGFSVTVGGNTYNSTGVYTDVLTNAAGCDSTVTTTLNISQPTTFSQTFDECQGFSVTVGGNTYNSTGVYTDVLTNAAGCDSTVTTTLNISQPTTFSQTFDECQGFSVTVGGNTYTSTGVYTDVLTNAAGCDSTVTTNLTVNPLPTVTFAAINPDTICEGASPINLTGGSPAGGTYSGNGVSGTSFDPATAGLGTQTITYSYTDANNCSNTASTDVEVALCASTSMQNVDYQIQVYPNPTTSTVNLSIEGLELEGLRLSVYDVLGRQIETRMVDEYIEVIDLGQLLDGVYLIRLEGPNTAFVQSVIKQ